MGKRSGFGVGKCASLLVSLLLLSSVSVVACSSDPPADPGPVTGAGGASDAGAPSVDAGGNGGEPAMMGEGGTPTPVTPGDLVCKTDDDCTSADKPVCDQVEGCVACQYDWDCPANHRCTENQCFEKHPCTTSEDCAKDAAYPVCDAVQQLCVGCREDADCGDGKRCQASACVAFEACANSRGCSDGKVCDRSVGACVACVVDGDCGEGSACVNDACVPTCQSDKECLGIGLLCDLKVGRCVECLSHDDCPEQYFCGTGGRCTLDVCEKGQSRCENEHQLGTCTDTGEQFMGATCAGDTRCVEEGKTASCVPLTCTPGATTCSADLAAVEHCSLDGLKVESTEPCPDGQACNGGACAAVVCAPNAPVCTNNSLYQCNASGTATTLVKSCAGVFGGTCDEASGTCKAKVCSSGSPMCDGNLATVCAPDGLGPVPSGTDCAADAKACWNGECLPRVCTDTYVCQGSLLEQCQNNGTLLQQAKDCAFASLCDAAGAKCTKPTCTPGAFVCDGNVATRCKSDGSGYVSGGTDCAATDQVCDGGGCLAKSCTPQAYFCSGGSPQHCGASGATYTPTDTCSVNEYCSDSSSYCLSDKCTAGAAVCNGNLATTCTSDGSGPVAGGTDCAASGKICEAGACKDVVCTSGALSCQAEAVYVCNPNGTGTTLSKACFATEYCDNSGEKAACAADICTGGALGCSGEVIATCGANGGSWTNPGVDCKTTGQVCVLGGTCAAQEIATQGTTTYGTTQGTNSSQLALFRVLTARKLTKLETQASFGGLQKLTWVVYEKRAGAETYDLVYQKVTSQTMPVAGIITSPVLDFKLEKGKSYAVGVHVSGNASFAYQYYSGALYVVNASFLAGGFAGTAGGSSQPESSISTPASTPYKTYLRLTTSVAP